nr:MAG: hypothetical protein [Cressdnaviricota sp.]
MPLSAVLVRAIQFRLGSTKHWPRAIRRIMMEAPTLDNRTRFTVVCFMLCNGMMLKEIRLWLNQRWELSPQDVERIDQIINKYPKSTWSSWNMAENKSCNHATSRQAIITQKERNKFTLESIGIGEFHSDAQGYYLKYLRRK